MDKMMKCKQLSVFMLVLASAFMSLNLVAADASFEDQKNYYSHDPHHGSTPPSGSHHGPTPSHGGSYGGSPPTHTTPSTPSTPSTPDCGTPPYTPTPSTPTPTPPSGGGSYYPPSPPTPTTPTTPTTPGTPYIPPTTPGTPPFVPDPNSPFSCNYWRNHPGLIWGLLGWWGTLGSAFGVTGLPGYGATMTLPQALSNSLNDGYGTLYREGTASLLNSMVTHNFPFTARQVRESFVAALGSNRAAASQGRLFKMANEGRIKR